MPVVSSFVHTDHEILSGTQAFVGTRVPVRMLFDYLETGDSRGEFLEDFLSISRERDDAASRFDGPMLEGRCLLDFCCPTGLGAHSRSSLASASSSPYTIIRPPHRRRKSPLRPQWQPWARGFWSRASIGGEFIAERGTRLTEVGARPNADVASEPARLGGLYSYREHARKSD